MATDSSFDIVSKVDLHTMEDCINIALKEIENRYDFKGSNSMIELDKKALTINLTSSDEFKVKALYDVVLTRLSKRNIPLKNLKPEKIESALGGAAKQLIKIQQGIPTDKAKEIIKEIKNAKLKVTASIQDEQVRVTSKSRDSLQETIALLKGKDFGITLQFENYR